MTKHATTLKKQPLTFERFNALSDAEKERIYQELDSEDPKAQLARSKPLSKKERAEWNAWKRRDRVGRPRIGKGAKMVALSVERDLLKQADTYAKAHKMKRSELVAKGLRAVMGLPA